MVANPGGAFEDEEGAIAFEGDGDGHDKAGGELGELVRPVGIEGAEPAIHVLEEKVAPAPFGGEMRLAACIENAPCVAFGLLGLGEMKMGSVKRASPALPFTMGQP